jgi:hypothetical protein
MCRQDGKWTQADTGINTGDDGVNYEGVPVLLQQYGGVAP